MKRPATALLPVVVLLGACGEETPPPGEVHNAKYEAVGDGSECAFDRSTGLTWEVKDDAPGLHDWRNTYSWYHPEESHDELDYRGLADGGECAGSACDTWELVIAANAEGRCGYHDWRIPTRDELLSISDLKKASTPPTIDITHFPHAQAGEYWSAYDYSFQHDAAWAWSFEYGHDRVDWKKAPKYVRLVRGSASELPEVKE